MDPLLLALINTAIMELASAQLSYVSGQADDNAVYETLARVVETIDAAAKAKSAKVG